jgi:hypothetical protein
LPTVIRRHISRLNLSCPLKTAGLVIFLFAPAGPFSTLLSALTEGGKIYGLYHKLPGPPASSWAPPTGGTPRRWKTHSGDDLALALPEGEHILMFCDLTPSLPSSIVTLRMNEKLYMVPEYLPEKVTV